MDKNQKPASEETSEIDDKALDQVVGGAAGLTKPGSSLIIDSTEEGVKKTNSFGGEDWEKR